MSEANRALASTFRFERSRVILDTRAGEPENLKGGLRPFRCYRLVGSVAVFGVGSKSVQCCLSFQTLIFKTV